MAESLSPFTLFPVRAETPRCSHVKKLINLQLVWNTMCSFENKRLKDCPHSLKPVFYRLYVDDIFVLFFSLDQAEKFIKCFSSKHPNINFSLEKENDTSHRNQ